MYVTILIQQCVFVVTIITDYQNVHYHIYRNMVGPFSVYPKVVLAFVLF